jgi:hypothetical protein
LLRIPMILGLNMYFLQRIRPTRRGIWKPEHIAGQRHCTIIIWQVVLTPVAVVHQAVGWQAKWKAEATVDWAKTVIGTIVGRQTAQEVL